MRRYTMFVRCPSGLLLLLAPVMLSLAVMLTSCKAEETAAGGERMKHSRLLTLSNADGYHIAEIRNPWDSTKILQRLILAEAKTETQLPEGTVVKIPLSRSLVMSSVHCSLLEELGCAESVRAVCDAEYINSEAIRQRIAEKRTVDCGSSMAPSVEHIASANPDAILISPYENIDNGKIERLGCPLIQCADYMEPSPLGRAEWIRFYGLLFGKQEEADSIFKTTEKRYLAIKALTDTLSIRPVVMSDLRYGQVWYVPSDSSTVGQLYHDAGARNAFAGFADTKGSIALSPEQVLKIAHDADIWLIKTDKETSMKTLTESDNIYKQFLPYRNRNIFVCNTMTSRFYEREPFHPELLLLDFVRIFHPELNIEGDNSFYYRINEK